MPGADKRYICTFTHQNVTQKNCFSYLFVPKNMFVKHCPTHNKVTNQVLGRPGESAWKAEILHFVPDMKSIVD